MPRTPDVRARCLRFSIGAATMIGGLLCATMATDAHKTLVSRYTYNEHVFPIFRDRCGACHTRGGAAPMSLLTYADAAPWANAIRVQVATEAMPPWFVDPRGAAIKGSHSLTPHELDVVVTWAAGGTPEGDASARPPGANPSNDQAVATPDLVLRIDHDYRLSRDTPEGVDEFLLPTGLRDERWVKAIGLVPSRPSMVRDAVIAIDHGPVLAAWLPGEPLMAAPAGTAFRLPAATALRVRVRYQKPLQDEQPLMDRSAVAVYFAGAPSPAGQIRTMTIAGRPTPIGGEPLRVLAVTPALDRAYSWIDVHAIRRDGTLVPLLRLRAPRPGWTRRYWLETPVELPAGSTVEVTAAQGLFDDGRPSPFLPPALTVAVDVVSRTYPATILRQ